MSDRPAINMELVVKIKTAIEACKRLADVDAAARHFVREVAALEQSADPELKVMAIQIKNLAIYQRMSIANGWTEKTNGR